MAGEAASAATTVSGRGALREVAEPTGLRRTLHDRAASGSPGARAEIAEQLADRLWTSWRAELAPGGASPQDLRALVAASGNEPWLWVMGDRPWNQLLDTLAGRATRRLASIERASETLD